MPWPSALSAMTCTEQHQDVKLFAAPASVYHALCQQIFPSWFSGVEDSNISVRLLSELLCKGVADIGSYEPFRTNAVRMETCSCTADHVHA